MLNSKFIGEKIVAARKKVNLSQAELAQRVMLSSQAVGKWERGESMPDITTLNRLAEIFGVDLNYFSESFQSLYADESVQTIAGEEEKRLTEPHKEINLDWDMSKLHLVESDFSGLKNLHAKFNSSNMLKCLFVGSDLSDLQLKNNNIDRCDFTDSDFTNTQVMGSNLDANVFTSCVLKGTTFTKSNINACDFS